MGLLAPLARNLEGMTFSETPQGYRTFMGVDCRSAAAQLGEAGADVYRRHSGLDTE